MKYHSATRFIMAGIVVLVGILGACAGSSYLVSARAQGTALSAFELQNIAKCGGSLQIDASQYSAFELGEIAKSASSSSVNKGAVQVKVTLLNVQKLSAFDMQTIATASRGDVTFILDK